MLRVEGEFSKESAQTADHVLAQLNQWYEADRAKKGVYRADEGALHQYLTMPWRDGQQRSAKLKWRQESGIFRDVFALAVRRLIWNRPAYSDAFFAWVVSQFSTAAMQWRFRSGHENLSQILLFAGTLKYCALANTAREESEIQEVVRNCDAISRSVLETCASLSPDLRHPPSMVEFARCLNALVGGLIADDFESRAIPRGTRERGVVRVAENAQIIYDSVYRSINDQNLLELEPYLQLLFALYPWLCLLEVIDQKDYDLEDFCPTTFIVVTHLLDEGLLTEEERDMRSRKGGSNIAKAMTVSESLCEKIGYGFRHTMISDHPSEPKKLPEPPPEVKSGPWGRPEIRALIFENPPSAHGDVRR